MQQLTESIRELEDDASVQALILESKIPKIFSAGLNLQELRDPDPERLFNYWKAFQEVFLTLYSSRLACIAALEGPAVAGGCALALGCDYRIVRPTKARIGLSESVVGLACVPWMVDLYINTIGHRTAEKALALGTLFEPDQALEIGLVDEMSDNVESDAYVHAKRWTRIPASSRLTTKQRTRGRLIDFIEIHREKDATDFVNEVQMPATQVAIGQYLDSLRK